MTDEWTRDEFDAELASRDRVIVLYHDATPASLALRQAFEDAAPECSVPMARAHVKDATWRAWTPTVPAAVYYEHGEELERAATPAAFERLLETVEDLQERWRLIRGRLRVDTYG